MKTQVMSIGDAYGGLGFWSEVLMEDSNPGNVWRSLLYLGSLPAIPKALAEAARGKLQDSNSRVRAWACFTLGRSDDPKDLNRLHVLLDDPSPRVHYHAAHASARIFATTKSHGRVHRRVRPPEPIVLVSDDSEDIRDIIGSDLSGAGFRVAFAGDEEATISESLRIRPSALLTDNQKGKDNLAGVRLAGRISEMQELKETVILMLSADEIPGPFLWNGGDCFVPKAADGLASLRKILADYLVE